MGIDEDIQHWLRFAESDMRSAEALHCAGQELNALFHLQQAVEKTLKALLLRNSKVQPPRTHGLRGLSERCGLRLTSRYPGDWHETPTEVTAEEVERLMPETEEFIEWLQSQI